MDVSKREAMRSVRDVGYDPIKPELVLLSFFISTFIIAGLALLSYILCSLVGGNGLYAKLSTIVHLDYIGSVTSLLVTFIIGVGGVYYLLYLPVHLIRLFYNNLNMTSTIFLPKRLIYVALSAIIIGFITISCITMLVVEGESPIPLQ